MERAQWNAVEHPPHWRDTGCSVWPSCLSCPLPRCVHEVPGGVAWGRAWLRGQQVLEARQRRMTVPQLARAFGLSERQVYRILRAAKGGSP